MTSFNGFVLAFRSMSMKAAADIKASSIFSSTFGAQGLAFTLDAIADYGTPTEQEINGTRYEKRRGVGVRIALRMTEIKGRAAFTFAAVAAQAELGRAKVHYRVEGIGLDTATIAALLDVPIEQSFSAQTYLKIQAVIGKLAKHLKDPALEPGEYSVPLPPPSDLGDASRARTVNYAMAKIAQRVPLTDALHLAEHVHGLDAGGISVVYATYVGDQVDDEGAPKVSLAVGARHWLLTGSFE